MINIAKISDGESKDGKQLLFYFTVLSLGFMVVYYHNQIKLSKLKIEEMKIASAEKTLSHD